MDKEKKKIIKRKLGWFFLKLFDSLHGIFPLGWSYFIGGILGRLAYFILTRHRRTALESLGIAFPEYSLKKRKKIAYNFFVFMIQMSLESVWFLRNPRYLSNIRLEGRENLDKALEKGRGVIITTAHLGNFPIIGLKLAREGYPVNIIVRPMRDAKAGEYFHSLREEAGMKTILSYPRRECVSGVLQALKRNEIIIILIDQNFGTGGVWVNFFGKLAATPVGSVIFALRTNAAVVPGYIFRESKGKHCLKLLPQEEIILRDNKDETILVNVIKLTRIIEQWVRKIPYQWGWIHRRWKSRPSESIKKQQFKIEISDILS
jgi:KDO2-lipid IV(A) lauroyltransferase